jgi:hypothetical protein
MSIALEHFCLIVLVAKPMVVVLSACRGVGGWGWPNSFEGDADRDCFLGIDKHSGDFGFSSRGHDIAEDEAGAVNGSIAWRLLSWGALRVGGIAAEEEMATNAAGSFGGGKIGAISVDVQDHLTGRVSNHGVGIGGRIIEELDDSLGGENGCGRLCGSDGAEGNEHSWINGEPIVEQGADDLLYAGAFAGG